MERDYRTLTKTVAERHLRKLKPPPRIVSQLVSCLRRAAISDMLSYSFSGIVVTGYGSQEHYPSLVSYMTDGIFSGKLKIIRKDPIAITRQNSAILAPFAQSDAATLFMEGVDEVYQRAINESISDVLPGIAEIAGKFFGSTNPRRIASFRRVLQNISTDWINELTSIRRKSAMRVLDAIDILDKTEMSSLAESMVSVTALKQRVSLEAETVGGPIDVAFISRGEGFIWIKRKHYFYRSLNPFFFHRYLEDGGTK